MKVFTVGLEQKQPKIKELADGGSCDKVQPPPGYLSSNTSLPMGDAAAAPASTVIIRKSRGYKGILMVMLAVFLMAVFALTISEIAYTRQRDENFFRLRWAELRRRWLGGAPPLVGSGGGGGYGFDRVPPAEFLRHVDADRVVNFNAKPFQPATTEAPPTTTSQGVDRSTTTEDGGGDTIIVEEHHGPAPGGPFSQHHYSSASSSESMESGMGGGEGRMMGAHDARLEFLRRVLQKIKQHAEELGFDGTMQVSVVEVEPQEMLFGHGGGGSSPNMPPHSEGPHFPSPVMDGFGDYHQPSFMQNNQVIDGEEEQQPAIGPQQQMVHPPMNIFGPWQQPPQFPQHLQQQQQHHQQQWMPPHISPPVFFRFPQWQMMPMMRPMMQMMPQPQQPQQMLPMMPQQQQQVLPRPQQPWPSMMGGGQEDVTQQQLRQQQQQPLQQSQIPLGFPPPPPQQPQPIEAPSAESNTANAGSPQETLGENYGRGFGRVIQDIISNRAAQQAPQQLPPQQQQSPMMMASPPQMHMLQTLSLPTQSFQFQGEPSVPFPSIAQGGGGMVGSNQQQTGGQQQPPPSPQPMPAQLGVPQQWPVPNFLTPNNAGSDNNKPTPVPAGGAQVNGDVPNPQSPPSPVIFFPMPSSSNNDNNEPQLQQQQQPPRPFIPPENRIQIEPPAPASVIEQPQATSLNSWPPPPPPRSQMPQMGDQQPASQPMTIVKPAAEGSIEPSPASLYNGIIVDNNSGPRGWTHQQPPQQVPPVVTGEITGSRPQQLDGETLMVGGGVNGGKPIDETSGDGSAEGSESEDKWLVAPPSFAKPKSSSNADFPAVKFPLPSAVPPTTIADSDDAAGRAKEQTPQQQQTDGGDGPGEASASAIPANLSPPQFNPAAAQNADRTGGAPGVFFQVDDPTTATQMSDQQKPQQSIPL